MASASTLITNELSSNSNLHQVSDVIEVMCIQEGTEMVNCYCSDPLFKHIQLMK